MRTVRSTIALLLAFLLTAALCGCAASPPGESPGSAPAKPVDATDFMSCAGPVFPLTLEKAAPFRKDYLSGFQALRYDVQPENGLDAAKDRMRPTIEADCRDWLVM